MFLVACTQNVTLPLLGSTPVEVNVREAQRHYTLAPGSEGHLLLERWLQRNKSGWSLYYVTAPMCGVCVHAGDLGLNFLGGSVIAYRGSAMWTKAVEPSDYEFLKR